MADDNGDDDYEVGYKKPPKEHQFKKNNRMNPHGQRIKLLETRERAVGRVRDELVPIRVDGKIKRLPAFEVVLRQVFTKTMQSGKPRDLKALIELMDQYAPPNPADRYEEARQGADQVMRAISRTFQLTDTGNDERSLNDRQRFELFEIRLLTGCPRCAPALRKSFQERDETPPREYTRYSTRLRMQWKSWENQAEEFWAEQKKK